MIRPLVKTLVVIALGAHLHAQAQTGPFSPTNWPGTINPAAAVDYLVVDPGATFDTPAGWQPSITFAPGGDQDYTTATRLGMVGDQSTSSFMNIADSNFAQFGNVPVVDILLNVFGNDTLYNANGTGKTLTFREGALGTELAVNGGAVPPWRQ